MALLRNQEPKVLFSDNGVFSDVSEKLRTWDTPDFTFTWTASEDALYIGKRHKFNNLYVAVENPNTNAATMTLAYWNPGKLQWVNASDLVDETSCFAESGFIQWEEPGLATENQEIANWDKDEMSDITGLTSFTTSKEELYWVKITISANSRAGTIVKAFKQLLSDDRLMVSAHPEIMEYLPAGETSFLKQHELAALEITNELIVRGKIRHFDQIKRPDDFLVAATYKCIEIIFRSIPGDERLEKVKIDFEKKASRALDLVFSSIDSNQNESLDLSEVENDTQRYMTR